MNINEQIIYFLGYISATMEGLCNVACKNKSSELFELLANFEQHYNQEINRIFSLKNRNI